MSIYLFVHIHTHPCELLQTNTYTCMWILKLQKVNSPGPLNSIRMGLRKLCRIIVEPSKQA